MKFVMLSGVDECELNLARSERPQNGSEKFRFAQKIGMGYTQQSQTCFAAILDEE
jgi:hypothetical protein